MKEVGSAGIAAHCDCPKCGGYAFSTPKEDFRCECGEVVPLMGNHIKMAEASGPAYYIEDCPCCHKSFYIRCEEVEKGNGKEIHELFSPSNGVYYSSPDEKVSLSCEIRGLYWRVGGFDATCPHCSSKYRVCISRIVMGPMGIQDHQVLLYEESL